MVLDWEEAAMRRRQFVALLAGSALSLPLTAWAQRSTKVHRIAMLHPTHPVAELTETSSIYYYRAFFDELRRLGYIEGQNLTIERYSAEGHTENYLALARSVASRNPDAVYTVGAQMAKYLQEATSRVPIVVVLGDDPIAGGLAQSLARPGGNITGVSVNLGVEIWPKRLQILREIVPTISRVGFLMGPKPTAFELQRPRAVEKTGVAVVGPTHADNGSEAEYRRVVAAISEAGAEALFVTEDIENVGRRQLIAELASKFRLPAIYAHRVFAEAGGLMVYGADIAEILRQAARQIDKILKGGNPGEIPFYQAAKFELIINLKAAKELGLIVPPSMLSLADELIE
jgi:putative tryptophan/tyrosine transport system substrate-binding protein